MEKTGALFPDSKRTQILDSLALPQDDNNTQVDGQGGRPVPSANVLKGTLVDTGLVTSDQWDRAARVVGDTQATLRILTQLMEHGTSVDLSGRPTQALTEFQVRQIMTGAGERLRLAHYVIVDRLGQGGMGEVYKARDLTLNQLVAVKTISPQDGDTLDTKAHERFLREARLLTQLRHPGFPVIYYFGQSFGCQFIAMEFIRGRTLKQLIEDATQKQQPIPIAEVTRVILAAGRALKYAHERGIIHRDIKHHNIMVTDEGEVKVLDLGIGKMRQPQNENTNDDSPHSGLTMVGSGMGTPEFMSPEQWTNARTVTPAADIYSLGITYYYLLTGELPFRGTMTEIMKGHFAKSRPVPSRLRKEIPSNIDQIVAKMIAIDVVDRYQELGECLHDIENSDKAKALVSGPPVALWGGIAGAVALVVALGLFFGLRGGGESGADSESSPNNKGGLVPGEDPAAQMVAAAKAGNHLQARAMLTEALEQSPNKKDEYHRQLFDAYLAAARADADAQKWGEAAAAIDRALPYGDVKPWVELVLDIYLGDTKELVAKGDTKQARERFQSARELLRESPPDDPSQWARAYHALGSAAATLGDRDLALALLNSALEKRPNQADILTSRGKVHEQRGDLALAAEDFLASARADVRLAADLQTLAGKTYAKRGEQAANNDEFAAASDAYLNAAKWDVTNKGAYLANALKLFRQNTSALRTRAAFDEALAVYRAAPSALLEKYKSQFDADQADILNERARERASRGDFLKAIEDLREAAKLNAARAKELNAEAAKFYGDGNRSLGRTAYDRKQYDEAIKHFNTAATLDPEKAATYRGLVGIVFNAQANILYREGNFLEAVKFYQKAIEVDPSKATYYFGIGLCHHSLGAWSEAVSSISAAIERDPTKAEYYSWRGEAYLNGRINYSKARSDFTRALKLNPNDNRSNSGMAALLSLHPNESERNLPKALEHARAASRGVDDPNVWKYLLVQATIFAMNQEFETAAELALRAESNAPAEKKDEARRLVDAYRQQQTPRPLPDDSE